MRVTVRHVVDFGAQRNLVGGALVRPDAWDALRTRTDGPFAIAATRAELDRQADSRADIATRARALDAWLGRRPTRRLVSYGVGGGVLECWLERLSPEREMVLTEYAPVTLERLRALFPDRVVVRHDLRVDPPLDGQVHLFHRIDTELSNRQWRAVLRRFASCEVLVLATELIDGRRAAAAIRTRLRNRHVTDAGWVRNRAAFEALWRPTHQAERLRFADLHAWRLVPR